MIISLNPSAPAPLFEQLTEEIRRQIIHGRIGAGERLPSAKDLAQALELNMHTVLRSYQALREEGLIVMRPGRGSQVNALPDSFTEVQQLLKHAVELAQASGITAPSLITTIKDLY